MQLLHKKGQQTLEYLHSEFTIKLRVCHFSYFTLVTEGALIIFCSPKKTPGGAYRSRGAKWGEYGILLNHCIHES